VSTTRPPLTFSTTRRPSGGRRVARGVGLVVATVLAILLVWGLVVGGLWVYAWARLGGEDIPALRDDVTALGARGATAPADATTLLVTLTGPVDPTIPRPSPLVGPVALVQLGGPRDEPAVLLLPEELTVTVDGVGESTLAEVQTERGTDVLTRAVVDYTEIRIDHVVSLSVDALPRMVDALAPVQICGGGGCSEPDGDEVRARLEAAEGEELVRVSAEVLRSLALAVDGRWAASSPLRAKRLVDAVAEEVTTDVSLRGTSLLGVARALTTPVRLDVDTVPVVLNPATNELVTLEEPTMVRFQHLREGTPLAGSGDPVENLEADLIAEVEVGVLNAAGIDGLAGQVRVELEARGYRVVGTGNATAFDRERTVISFAEDDETAVYVAGLLAEELGGAALEPGGERPTFEGEPVDLLVLTGSDLDR
jgi:hypothetical protein